MTPYRKRQTEATRRMAEDMTIRNFAVRTIDSYTYHVDRFSKHFGKMPEDLGPEQVREFQLWMRNVNESSWSQFNQAVCALRFLYSVTLPRPWVVHHDPFGKRGKKLPTVLSQAEVHQLIQCVHHPKHRAVILTLYAAGLRLSEATHLKVKHIDSARMQLKVEAGKGGKIVTCASLSETLDRVENLLGQLQAERLPLSRQDSGHSAQRCSDTEVLQAGGCSSPHQQTGDSIYLAALLRHWPARSRTWI